MRSRSLKYAAAVLLICVMLFSFTACTVTLNGTYTNKSGLVEQSFIFKDDNRVALSAFGLEIEGDYVIEDGEITITYSLLGLHYDWVKSFDKKGDSIFVDGLEFVKEK